MARKSPKTKLKRTDPKDVGKKTSSDVPEVEAQLRGEFKGEKIRVETPEEFAARKATETPLAPVTTPEEITPEPVNEKLNLLQPERKEDAKFNLFDAQLKQPEATQQLLAEREEESFLGTPLTGTEAAIGAGAIAAGAGAVALGGGAVGRLGSTASLQTQAAQAVTKTKGIIKTVQKTMRDRSIAKTAARNGKTIKQIEKALDKKILSNDIAKVADGINWKLLAASTGATALALGGAYKGWKEVEILYTWYGLDNVIGNAGLQSSRLAEAIKWDEEADIDEAIAAIEKIQDVATNTTNQLEAIQSQNFLIRRFTELQNQGVQISLDAIERDLVKLRELKAEREAILANPELAVEEEFQPAQSSADAAVETEQRIFESQLQ
tara:strand:- start:1701 stop:2840 length:1140 start_codon:yes stop_codon:yes gene_type:complete